MTEKEFKRLRAELDDYCTGLLAAKNTEYARQDKVAPDYLENFSTGAKWLGVDPMEVAGVYLFKHLASIFHHLRGGEIATKETLKSRLADARNYIDILYALSEEKGRAKNAK